MYYRTRTILLSRLLSHLVAVEVARDAGGGGDVCGGPVSALGVGEHVERGLQGAAKRDH